MAKVTKELIQSLKDAGAYPPRHQQGCPKNYARTLPLPLAASGMSINEIVEKVRKTYGSLPCECKEEGLLKEW